MVLIAFPYQLPASIPVIWSANPPLATPRIMLSFPVASLIIPAGRIISGIPDFPDRSSVFFLVLGPVLSSISRIPHCPDLIRILQASAPAEICLALAALVFVLIRKKTKALLFIPGIAGIIISSRK